MRRSHGFCPLTYLKIRLRNNAKTCSSARCYFFFWRRSHPFWRYLIIKELKGDYPLGKIPTKYFAANEADFHALLFSYNLINWFKRLCLPMEFQNMMLKTLRTRLLLIPGELIRPDNRPTLKLPTNFLYKDAFHHALKMIDKLKF